MNQIIRFSALCLALVAFIGVVGLPAEESSAVKMTLKVMEADSRRPIFSRVVLKDVNGKIIGSSGYRSLSGRFVHPEGWDVSLAPGNYRLEVDAGYEFFPHTEEWAVSRDAEKTIALRRWLDLRKLGWFGGGDHNHLTRDGSQSRNYGGTAVTIEFAAAMMASRGWTYYSSGGGGPWVVNGGGRCDARDDNNQTFHHGRRTEAAAGDWNQKYGDKLYLWWNNEAIKGRYGHIWVLGKSTTGLSYPYSNKAGDAWWAFYDDNWDPWQTKGRVGAIAAYRSGLWELPPVFDCIRSWHDQGWVSIYAHPTRTFHIGPHRVSNIAAEFPFDLLAGTPVGGLAIMGDRPDHIDDQALWFAALNEGFQVAGIAENDTVFGRDDIRAIPHTTFTHVPEMGAAFDLGKLAGALAAGRNVVSSGAFLDIQLDGKHRIGDTAPVTGTEHTLSVQAWASSDASDAIERIEIIAGGKIIHTIEAARGKRDYSGEVKISTDAKWLLVKLLCRKPGIVAITNPIYFRKTGEGSNPQPIRATVSGIVTRGGRGIPAEIIVTAWGKEVARTKTGADGAYRMEGIPLSAHFTFSHEGKSARKTILFDDPDYRDIHHRIYSTEWIAKPNTLGGCFPADIFQILRQFAQDVRLDADLGE